MIRNLKRNVSKKDYNEMKEPLYLAKESKTYEEGVKHFEEVCKIVEKSNKELGSRLRDRIPNYLAFLKYPEEVRKHIYTSNIIESINAGLESIRISLGGYFPSENAMEINYYLQIENLNKRWMKKPIPMIKAHSYELKQIHVMKYELGETEVSGHDYEVTI
ncbi:MAG: transposase [Thermoplasmata archaeon]